MKNPKRKVSIVGLCDSVMHMVRTLRREYLAQTASDRKLLCGEWVRPGGRVFLRVRKEGGRYLLDECWSNTVNSRVQVFTFRLLRDEQDNQMCIRDRYGSGRVADTPAKGSIGLRKDILRR